MDNSDSEPQSTHEVQEILLEFVAEWEEGKRPDLVAYVERIPGAHRRQALLSLINADMLQRKTHGESPVPNDYLKQFPADASTISLAFNEMFDTMGDREVHEPDPNDTQLDLSSGQSLGKYEIREVLGVGGMGVVYGAYDTVILREVAIKLLSRQHAGDEIAMNRLLQEAQTAGSLQHPNIVGIFDVFEQDGLYFVVMEKVTGANLGELLNDSESGRLDWESATRIVIDCCDALSAAHEKGMIHRDIKPQNIMMTDQRRAKLLDFGLAKTDRPRDTTLTSVGTVLGTPNFMSPEQCSADTVRQTSDLYSLGATYFALLTGHPPFDPLGSPLKVMYAHCHEPVPSVSQELPNVPQQIDTIIARAMAKKPEDRYQTAAEMKADLEALIGSPSSSTGTSQSGRSISAGESARSWSSIAIAILLVLAGGLWLIMSNQTGNNDGNVAQQNPDDGDSANPANSHTFRGVTTDSILLGTSTAYNGPSEELGRNMVVGMGTYFESVNAAGGINGRTIQLIVLDDRYDPDKALANLQDLFERRKVFAVIGNVGTPTGRVTSKYASEHQLTFFAPFTGASLLREDPPDRYIFNYRASYENETAALVNYFVERQRIAPGKIAVFAQNDSFGDDGFHGVVKAMRSYGIQEENILRVGYERNTLNIDNALARITDETNDVEAMIMVSTYKVSAKFVKAVRSSNPEMQFGAVSFVGSKAFAEEFRELGAQYGEGVIVTQVVPHYMSNATGVIRYRDLLSRYFPEYEPGFVSLEGFIAAECFVEGLRKAGPELTTESFIDALHTIKDLDLGIGPIIQFSPSRHQASNKV